MSNSVDRDARPQAFFAYLPFGLCLVVLRGLAVACICLPLCLLVTRCKTPNRETGSYGYSAAGFSTYRSFIWFMNSLLLVAPVRVVGKLPARTDMPKVLPAEAAPPFRTLSLGLQRDPPYMRERMREHGARMR